MSPIQVLGTGFNAFGQVLRRIAWPKRLSRKTPKVTHDHETHEPNDVHEFSSVSPIPKDSVDVEPHLTHTVVKAERSEPAILGIASDDQKALHRATIYRLWAWAANGNVAVLLNNHTIRVYESARTLLAKGAYQEFPGFTQVVQLVAYELGFAVLDSTGQVWTWEMEGGERFPECLGREAATIDAVHRPGRVVALLDLPTGPIRKIAANGYTLGALTGKGDLYCWGCRPPGRQPFLNNLNGTPNLEDVYGKAIVDFGIGESHMIVLTEDDKVMVIGHNTDGQLGIPGLEKADTWTEVPLDLEGDKTVMAVRAGPRTSFLIVESGWKKDSSSDSEEESSTEEDDGTHSVDNNFNREGGRSCRKRRFRGI